MNTARFVAYFRVSTDRQGRSGLGLDAQRAAVLAHTQAADGILLSEFTEVESGKRKDCPELARALETCRKHKAVLVIAKLDRLARNVAFIANLMEARVDFVACDFPQANRLTLHIMAAVAEHEREMISERTKAALAAAKARGRRLGWSNPTRTDQAMASRNGAQRAHENAETFAANVLPVVDAIRAAGVTSLRGIAQALNARGIPTARGGQWYAATVRNLLERRPVAAAKVA